jgi:hypothetical protein
MLALALGAAVWTGGRAAAQASKVVTEATCAADLGTGEQTRRRFCDVVIADSAAGSIRMAVPPHKGPATLQMDLHNRFTIPAANVPPGDAYERQTAVVAVVTPTGDVLERLAVGREFRTIQDLFDRITGGGRVGGVKGVAPGPAEPVRVIIPAGIDAIGVIGIRLSLLTRTIDDTYDAPGRPVAIASNFRIEYTPQ